MPLLTTSGGAPFFVAIVAWGGNVCQRVSEIAQDNANPLHAGPGEWTRPAMVRAPARHPKQVEYK